MKRRAHTEVSTRSDTKFTFYYLWGLKIFFFKQTNSRALVVKEIREKRIPRYLVFRFSFQDVVDCDVGALYFLHVWVTLNVLHCMMCI